MKSGTIHLRTWLRLTSLAVLATGLVCAGILYWSALNAPADSEYEIMGGFMYPGGGYDKKYIHDLQLYGGSAAVLSDQFMRWFSGLWHGTQLAYTVAIIAIILAFLLFVIANNVAAHRKSDVKQDTN